MARPPLSQDIVNAMIRDWEYGLYTNLTKLGEAHGVSFHTAKKMINKAKSIHGSRSDELIALQESTKQFILEPTSENAKKMYEVKNLIPITNLFDMEAIEQHTNGLVAKDIMEDLEEELIKSTLILINARANHNIRKNTKTIFASAGKEGSYATEVPLDSGDLKNYVEIADKSLIALGLADRFAPKGDINVQQNNIDGVIKYQATLPTLDEETTEAIDVEPLKEAI